MKKRQFLAPLATSLVALLGSIGVTTQEVAAKPEIASPASIAQENSSPTGPLVITRADGAAMRLADHESHMSHESHASHSSHSSHVSGN